MTNETMQQRANRLGYQATFTSRGVRLWKAGGRFVTFQNETNAHAYLRKVDSVREKQAVLDI